MSDKTSPLLDDIFVALCLVLANQLADRDDGPPIENQEDAIHAAVLEIRSMRAMVHGVIAKARTTR